MLYPRTVLSKLPPHSRSLALLLNELERLKISLMKLLPLIQTIELYARESQRATEAQEEGGIHGHNQA